MKPGRYGPGNTDFSKLRVSKFPLHLFNKTDFANCGCGPNALALLTGVNPRDIRGKDHASDRFMVDFLRRHGISVYEITKANLTRDKKISYNITDQNVILSSLLLRKAESSWFVFQNSYSFHNFSITATNIFDLINWPIMSQYCLWHPSWE